MLSIQLPLFWSICDSRKWSEVAEKVTEKRPVPGKIGRAGQRVVNHARARVARQRLIAGASVDVLLPVLKQPRLRPSRAPVLRVER